MSHPNFRITQNSIFPRCVDGRAAAAIVEWQNGQWQVTARGNSAETQNGPQFLGASLLFVKALEEVAGLDNQRAFDLTEEASRQFGLELQIHLDDAHGHHNYVEMADAEVIDLMNHHHTGCGFAKYAWSEQGDQMIMEAKKRHWRLQLLKGAHEEKGATLNYLDQETFDTATAVATNQSQFNTDVATARQVFDILEELTDQPGFAEKAEAWMVETFKDVAIALKGVQSKDEVLVIE